MDTTHYKDSLRNLYNELVLQILPWLGEEERTKIKNRQREGIEAAKKKGKHLGRSKLKSLRNLSMYITIGNKERSQRYTQ